MKKVLLAVVILMLMSGVAMAHGKKDVCDTPMGEIYNKCAVDNDTVSDKKNMEMGVGLDLVLYEDAVAEIDYKITGEYRYDWQNVEHTAYVVATIKLKDIINKFKKEE